MSGKILRRYVSDTDRLLQNFDKEHPEVTESQKKEIEKYNRIYFLRDSMNRQDPPKKLWEGF